MSNQVKRRTSRSLLAVALSAATTLALCGAPVAQAATAVSDGTLPEVGAELRISLTAPNSRISVGPNEVDVDFQGGIRLTVAENPEDPDNSRILQPTRFKMSGPYTFDENPYEATFKLADDISKSKGVLRLTQQEPPRYEVSLTLALVMEIVNDGVEEMDAVVLQSAKPAMVLGEKLTKFPSTEQAMKLTEKVVLTPGGEEPDEDEVPAALLKLSMKQIPPPQ